MSSPGPLDYLTAIYRPSTPGALLAYAKLPTFTRLVGYPSGLHKFAERLLDLDKAHDVYLTVNTLDSKAIQARGEFARGLETEVAAVVALVADVDAEKPKHNYPPQSVILNTLADMPLQPSVIVVSGRADGGLHPYWLLAEPFTIRTEADRDRIKRVSKEWQRLLKSKLAPYELDSTFDLVRVLRPIGTTNKKYGSTVSALVFEPDRRFTVEDFERHLPRPEPARPWTPPPSATGGSISERAARYVATIPGAISGQGGHDATFHVAAVLVEGFGLSVADAMPIMGGWNTTCQPPWTNAELLHKLVDANEQAERRGYLLTNEDRLPAGLPMVDRLVLVGA
jgi:hypothetical protein